MPRRSCLVMVCTATDPGSDTITIKQLLDHQGGYNDGQLPNVSSAPDPTYDMREIAIQLGLSSAIDYSLFRPRKYYR